MNLSPLLSHRMDREQRNEYWLKPAEKNNSTDVNISVETVSSPLNTRFNRLGFVFRAVK